MLYVDNKNNMISDTDDKELRFFSFKLGCNDSQFIRGIIHRYKLTNDQCSLAQIYGARFVSHRKLLYISYKYGRRRSTIL